MILNLWVFLCVCLKLTQFFHVLLYINISNYHFFILTVTVCVCVKWNKNTSNFNDFEPVGISM